MKPHQGFGRVSHAWICVSRWARSTRATPVVQVQTPQAGLVAITALHDGGSKPMMPTSDRAVVALLPGGKADWGVPQFVPTTPLFGSGECGSLGSNLPSSPNVRQLWNAITSTKHWYRSN